jgi:hypothetical protein
VQHIIQKFTSTTSSDYFFFLHKCYKLVLYFFPTRLSLATVKGYNSEGISSSWFTTRYTLPLIVQPARRNKCANYFLISHQNLMFIHCSENWSLIFETRSRNTTSYQHQNFHTAGISALESQLVQVETFTDMSLLWSSIMGTLKSCNKIIPGSS